MKKLFIFFLALFVFMPSTWAAEVASSNSSKIAQNKSWLLPTMKITSTDNADITAKYGIRLLLNPDLLILWQSNALNLTGPAVDSGKVMANVAPEYSKDYKMLYIPVKKDFVEGDFINIDGLMVKTYDNGFDYQFMGVDLNADLKADVTDAAGYSVSKDPKNDVVAPYPVTNVTYKINPDHSVSLKWTTPPDYDYQKTMIEREGINKDGFPEPAIIYTAFAKDNEFTDLNFKNFSNVTYRFTAMDYEANKSTTVTLKVDQNSGTNEPTDPYENPDSQNPNPIPVPGAADEEIQKLEKLMGYYLLRYQIHCTPNGVAVKEPSYDCFWPRIDLVYAQQLTGDIKVKDLTIPARDLEYMQTSRKWTTMRYDTSCVNTSSPADYCGSLKGALDRISYFID